MAIIYEKIDITEKSEGLYNATVKIIVDDWTPPYEKVLTLEYRDDRPQYFEGNLAKETNEFIEQIKKLESDKDIDISTSLDKVTIVVNETYKAVIINGIIKN